MCICEANNVTEKCYLVTDMKKYNFQFSADLHINKYNTYNHIRLPTELGFMLIFENDEHSILMNLKGRENFYVQFLKESIKCVF